MRYMLPGFLMRSPKVAALAVLSRAAAIAARRANVGRKALRAELAADLRAHLGQPMWWAEGAATAAWASRWRLADVVEGLARICEGLALILREKNWERGLDAIVDGVLLILRGRNTVPAN